jgi:hypothetical protein
LTNSFRNNKEELSINGSGNIVGSNDEGDYLIIVAESTKGFIRSEEPEAGQRGGCFIYVPW